MAKAEGGVLPDVDRAQKIDETASKAVVLTIRGASAAATEEWTASVEKMIGELPKEAVQHACPGIQNFRGLPSELSHGVVVLLISDNKEKLVTAFK